MRRRLIPLLLLLCAPLLACKEPPEARHLGYLEGEFVHVAAALAGRVEAVHPRRGDVVAAGDALFDLEREFERQDVARAEARLRQTQDTLRDLGKGLRPEEMEQIQARLEQARSAARLAQAELVRREALRRKDVIAQEPLDEARAALEREEARVADLTAQLAAGRLGSREDQRAAAQAQVQAAQAELDQARWRLAQKSLRAPVAGLVQEIFHYPGEWAAAGAPVLAILPPEQVKCRFFVPQTALAGLRVNQPVAVWVDGEAQPLPATISYLSPRAEYTPPVIYSQEFRARMVFMVEARFPVAQGAPIGARLHPGQPVEVWTKP